MRDGSRRFYSCPTFWFRRAALNKRAAGVFSGAVAGLGENSLLTTGTIWVLRTGTLFGPPSDVLALLSVDGMVKMASGLMGGGVCFGGRVLI